MAGISHNCKTGDVPAFGDCVGGASKALCGLSEAAGQVRNYQLHSQPLNIFTSEQFYFVYVPLILAFWCVSRPLT